MQIFLQPRAEAIGGLLLRKFDPVSAMQLKDENGRVILKCSPGRPVAVFVQIDGITSGIEPGVPTPPFLVNPPASIAMFSLAGFIPIGCVGHGLKCKLSF